MATWSLSDLRLSLLHCHVQSVFALQVQLLSFLKLDQCETVSANSRRLVHLLFCLIFFTSFRIHLVDFAFFFSVLLTFICTIPLGVHLLFLLSITIWQIVLVMKVNAINSWEISGQRIVILICSHLSQENVIFVIRRTGKESFKYLL